MFRIVILTLCLTSCGPDDHVSNASDALSSKQLELASSDKLLSYRGGQVMIRPKIVPIFWGPEWNSNKAFMQKQEKMLTLLTGLSNAKYLNALKQYSALSSLELPMTSIVLDTSIPPNRTVQTFEGLNKVCELVNNDPIEDTVYMLYSSKAFDRKDNRCAWHYWGQCKNGKKLSIAYIPNLDGIAGCNPGDDPKRISPGVAAIAQASVHELVETITDPRGNGWKDSLGNEVADKCAWTWPQGGITTLSNQSKWKIQTLWSNKAFIAQTGVPNARGDKGCVNQ